VRIEVSEAEATWALEHSGSGNPQQMLETNELHAALHAALDTLTPREKEVMTLYYGLDGEPQFIEDLSKKFGICKKRVYQIHEKALQKLRRKDRICQLREARID